jgi:hypothetical protein
MMTSLNLEQLQFTLDILHHLKTSDEPVYRLLSGGAGTGKSYVLKALRHSAERHWKSKAAANFERSWTMTVAPTGKAAFLAGGATIHSVLHVPVNQSLTYRRLDHESLNSLRAQIDHIKLWLIDEISMVGNRLFTFIDQRLQEVNNTNVPFGGCSVIAFGDLFQLPPVMDSFIFHEFRLSTSHSDDYSALAPNIWRELFSMFELTQIMRQQDCLPFAELLNRLRECNHTAEDIQALETRLTTPNSPDYPISVQHLFRTNASVESFNSHVFNISPHDKVLVTCIDSAVGAISHDMAEHALNLIPTDARKTMQLAQQIQLAIGCRYELSLNLNISDGLANGAGGVLKQFQLTSTDRSASGILWMQFDDPVIGSQARLQNRSIFTNEIDLLWTPIHPVCRQFQIGRNLSKQVMRKQFPVRLSAAKTIHCSQGDTMDHVVVDFTSRRKECHTHYVGLSRVRTLEGLHILNLCRNKIAVSDAVKSEMSELRSHRHMSLSLYWPVQHPESHYHIAFLNARSLHKHINCIRHDPLLTSCDLNFFCETWTSHNDGDDFYTLPDFEGRIYHDTYHATRRSHYGLAMYSKLPILFSQQPVTLSSSHATTEAIFTITAVHPTLLLIIACVYRRPNSNISHFRDAMSTHLSELSRVECLDSHVQQHTIIVGDFNLDWFDQSTGDIMSQIFPTYRQLADTFSTDYNLTLDHVYTTLPDDTVRCYISESYFTDHKPLKIALPLPS